MKLTSQRHRCTYDCRRKPTTKKNWTWDGDGILVLSSGYVKLQDLSGKEIGRRAWEGPLLVGAELSLAGRIVEVDSTISKHDYLAGRPSAVNIKKPIAPPREVNEPRVAFKTQVKQESHVKQLDSGKEVPGKKAAVKPQIKNETGDGSQRDRVNPPVTASQAPRAPFKAPLLPGTAHPPSRQGSIPKPLHEPTAENALVMKRPKSIPKGKQIVDVVVDPLVAKRLRAHQRVGVSFLYECVMGMKDYGGEGAILADEMGLGKTLQTIAVLWTLMKQNPIHGEPPVVKKALVVCPATLVRNWWREFRKWVGKERIGVFMFNDKRSRITDFTKGRSYSVMVVSYEKLRIVQDELQKGHGVDIVIADEGHRLKTAQNKAALAIKSLNTERRIILSGTPIQNDLAEFHTMVEFVNPGLLSKYSKFKREFENPILRSQQPGATEKDLEEGKSRSEELAHITGTFILRRTSEVLSRYLPDKTEYVLFCKPTEAQCSVYRAILGSPLYNAVLGSGKDALGLITVLKKVCNSPKLLLQKDDQGQHKIKTELLECIPQQLLKSAGASGKLQVLDSLLHLIRTTTDDKVVLLSNYTSTMDVLAGLLTSLSYKFLRLDGSTPANKRQEIVDRFNNSPAKNAFVFLLSAKAGGTGLNLIGASRLILFDIDWNPSTDLQAMARIHRDGQKKPCFIYRLLTQGAIDEKIFQRQVAKTGLADSIVDGKAAISGFTREELRDLFSLDESIDCQTHQLLSCSCSGNGIPLTEQEDNVDSPRNDLAALISSETICNDDGIEIVRLDGEQSSQKFKGSSWRTAKDYDARAEDAAMRGTDSVEKARMLSLMQYAHFDTSLVQAEPTDDTISQDSDMEDGDVLIMDPLEGVIEDNILRSALREKGRRITFVFSKLNS